MLYREMEEYFLQLFNVKHDKASYNIWNSVARPHNWKPMPSEERNKKTGAAIKQAWNTGRNIGMSGKKHSVKSKERISFANKGKPSSIPKGSKRQEGFGKKLSGILLARYQNIPKIKGRKDSFVTRKHKANASIHRELTKSLRRYASGYRPSRPQQVSRYKEILTLVHNGTLDPWHWGIDPCLLED